MNFQVPQFIEVEDKIFGPLTFKQFLYVAGGAGLSFLTYVFVPTYLKYLVIMAIAGVALGLAFYKVNQRPLVTVAEAGFKYLLSKKLYLWDQTKNSAPTLVMNEKNSNLVQDNIPRLSSSKLNDLSWSLDIQEHIK